MKTVKTKSYKWKMTPEKRSKTNYIVLHHAAAVKASPDDVHKWHLNNGWSGIGYHIYITKTGEAYHGRPLDTIGSHAYGYNSESIGVCFEGNFETETMPAVQKLKGIEVMAELKAMYPKAKVVGHRNLMGTSCPGSNFPFDEIANATIPQKKVESGNDIVWELVNGQHKIEITEQKRAIEALDKAKNNPKFESLYWIIYKLVNKGR